MFQKLSLQQSRYAILAEAVQTGNVACLTREYQHGVAERGKSCDYLVMMLRDLHNLPCISTSNAGNILMVSFDQIQWSGKVFLPTGRMLRTLEVKLRKRRIAQFIFYARNFVVFAMSRNSLFLQNVIPTGRISVDREGTAFADSAPYSQFASTNLLALGTVHEEMSPSSFPGRASGLFVHLRHLEISQRFTQWLRGHRFLRSLFGDWRF